jgi:hypothetical protein
MRAIMGFRICYIATPAPPQNLADALGLTIQSDSSDMPGNAWWVAQIKSSGWSILWAEDEGFGQSSRPLLLSLSHRAEVILCEVNETTMWSSAESFQNGQSLWRITHAGDGEDRFDLTVEGTPPEYFDGIRKTLEQQQRDDDDTVDLIFEIPLDVAAEMHMFRHDHYLDPAMVETVHILGNPHAKARKRGLFGFLTRH